VNCEGGCVHVALIPMKFVPLFMHTALPVQASKNIAMIPHP
jgi:hypothetical protein